jgi:Domain of unknown function (DUF4394)
MFKRSLVVAAFCCIGFVPDAGASQTVSGTDLYRVNLDSGELTLISEIGDGEAIIGLAVLPSTDIAGPAVGLTDDNSLIEFNVQSPGAGGGQLEISGLEDDEVLKGIDFRPANDELWAISDQSRLYEIDLETGEATSIGGVLDPEVESADLGFDFNPTVDRIRVDVSTGQNLRLNPETGKVGVNPDTNMPTIDGELAFADGDDNEGTDPNVVGAAYTNSVPDAEETQLYVLDVATQSLALQDPPNDGVLNTVGPLGTDIVAWAAFDIHPSGDAFVTNPNLEAGAVTTMPSTGSGFETSTGIGMGTIALIASGAVFLAGSLALAGGNRQNARVR